jgi:hypothetical protein
MQQSSPRLVSPAQRGKPSSVEPYLAYVGACTRDRIKYDLASVPANISLAYRIVGRCCGAASIFYHVTIKEFTTTKKRIAS